MTRKLAAVFLTIAWLALFGFDVLDDLVPDGPTAYGSRPVKATLVSLGRGINQEDDGQLRVAHKLLYHAKCFYALPIKSALSPRAEKEVGAQKKDRKLYKLYFVFLI